VNFPFGQIRWFEFGSIFTGEWNRDILVVFPEMENVSKISKKEDENTKYS